VRDEGQLRTSAQSDNTQLPEADVGRPQTSGLQKGSLEHSGWLYGDPTVTLLSISLSVFPVYSYKGVEVRGLIPLCPSV